MLVATGNAIRILSLSVMLTMGACGGGSSNSTAPTVPPPPPTTPPPPPPPSFDPEYRASSPSPFAANCEGIALSGTVAVNSEVEPHFAVDPGSPQRYFGAWQQDRWTSGGASGLGVGVSIDGGHSWSRSFPPFSRCAGGNAANGGNYERSSDPWVAISPDGTAYVIAIAFNGASLTPGSASSVLVSRSIDHGISWSAPTTLVREGGDVFHDKESITADPVDSSFVYAVWDRVSVANFGPTWFSRSVDGGASWEPARPIYDPGLNSQTLGNVIVVLPNGSLVDMYTHIDAAANGSSTAYLDLIRSADKGVTWSTPVRVASQLSVGTVDPETGMRVRDGGLVPAVAVGADGTLFAAWQDSRFTNGTHDGIVAAHSDDGGLSWSAPARVNSNIAVAAFIPAVNVRADGVVGITYFDLRQNTSDSNTLYTDLWLARSTDAVNWQESQISGPFDLTKAPQASWGTGLGYFIGDYQGLASTGSLFVPFYARTTAEGNGNRTDIFAAPAISVTNAYAKLAAELLAAGTRETTEPTSLAITPEFRRRMSENIEFIMQIHVPGKSRQSGEAD